VGELFGWVCVLSVPSPDCECFGVVWDTVDEDSRRQRAADHSFIVQLAFQCSCQHATPSSPVLLLSSLFKPAASFDFDA